MCGLCGLLRGLLCGFLCFCSWILAYIVCVQCVCTRPSRIVAPTKSRYRRGVRDNKTRGGRTKGQSKPASGSHRPHRWSVGPLVRWFCRGCHNTVTPTPQHARQVKKGTCLPGNSFPPPFSVVYYGITVSSVQVCKCKGAVIKAIRGGGWPRWGRIRFADAIDMVSSSGHT